MVSLAISGNPYFMVDDREIRRGGPSYTVDTLGSLQDDLPDAQLFLLMGADSLAELHTWREPQRICELAHVAVLARGGHPVPDLQLLSPFLPPSRPVDQAGSLVPMPQMEMSSTQIRARVAIGSSVRYQLAPAVEAYIEAQGLYRK
jgi:nicotinate-nucleotide adenylyltransferase